jgi:predicted O-methyltransferase YrrM
MTGRALDEIVAELSRDSPKFHGEGTRSWNATPGTLEVLAARVRAGDRTAETGCGASTVVFAAAGARHTSISPGADEHERVRAYCAELGVSSDSVEFVHGSSDRVLPVHEFEEQLDLVFVDGAHSYPYPVLDVHYLSPWIRTGGLLVLDDAPIPSVGIAFRALSDDANWEMVEIVDDRAAVFRKLGEPPVGDFWRGQPMNQAWPDLFFLPWRRRYLLRGRHRLVRARNKTLQRLRKPGR